jgi:hypothetical protein
VKKLLAAAVLAFPLFGQTRSETITVEVIDVPVYVYNAQGALQNLKKDDFELYVNGKPQTIDYFDSIDFRAPATGEAAPAPAVTRDIRDRRLFLLILDPVVEFKEKKLVIPSDAKQDVALRDGIHLPPGSHVAKALLRAGDSLGFMKQEFALR